MSDVIVIDSNIVVLLVVGSVSLAYIGQHKRFKGDYTPDDYLLVKTIVGKFSDIVLLPHMIAEVSNLLAKQMKNPAQKEIFEKFKDLISDTKEIQIPSICATARSEFVELGISDAMLLHLCSMDLDGLHPTLLTADALLANAASAHGYDVIDYRQIQSL